LRGGRLAIARQDGVSAWRQPIANRPPRDFRVEKTQWIISFNAGLTGRRLKAVTGLLQHIFLLYNYGTSCGDNLCLLASKVPTVSKNYGPTRRKMTRCFHVFKIIAAIVILENQNDGKYSI